MKLKLVTSCYQKLRFYKGFTDHYLVILDPEAWTPICFRARLIFSRSFDLASLVN